MQCNAPRLSSRINAFSPLECSREQWHGRGHVSFACVLCKGMGVGVGVGVGMGMGMSMGMGMGMGIRHVHGHGHVPV